MQPYSLSVWEEHNFWLKILEDHAYFVHDYLSPQEKKWTKQARLFIRKFSHLRKKLSEMDQDSSTMILFAKQAYYIAWSYYQFEGHLQHLRMSNQVNLNLTPTYFNGTLSENREYLRLLTYYISDQSPPLLRLTDLLDLWLEDQAGHALLLQEGVDVTEVEIIEQAEKFVQTFRSYIQRNKQWKGYLHFTKPIFPAQMVFVRNIIKTVTAFTRLVALVVKRHRQDAILNRLTLRFLEHHFPEACYFLHKLCNYLPAKEIELIPHCQITPPYFD